MKFLLFSLLLLTTNVSYAQNQRDSILVPEALPNKRFYPQIPSFNLTLSSAYNVDLKTTVAGRPVFDGGIDEYFFNLNYDKMQQAGYGRNGTIVYQVVSLKPENIYSIITSHAFNKQRRLTDSTFKSLNSLDTTLNKKILNLSTEINKITCTLFQDENSECYKSLVNKIVATIQEKYILTAKSR